eukprot:TRINITY_DN781979_c0_g1_i1.p1 TRINITY_DN781979_c0_g1~~TRINITY_DN781979_c0_g1_i1.p1  ORF type:complete len:519 (+),score=70.11 TRINITY_DN781979_c0_g1_i1:134-1690(+)
MKLKLFVWGKNEFGELGVNHRDVVEGPIENEQPIFNFSVESETGFRNVKISSGNSHSLMILPSGKLYCMGRNHKGQLGLSFDDKVDRLVPSPIHQFSRMKVLWIATGLNSSFAVDENNDVWSWGDNCKGQLGLGDTVNRSVPEMLTGFGLKKVKIISACDRHAACVTTCGKVYTWGSNKYNQLGVGPSGDCKLPTHVETIGDATIEMISCGLTHMLAFGQTRSTELLNPGKFPGIDGEEEKEEVDLSKVGNFYRLLLKPIYIVFAWGNNKYGQLGFGHFKSCDRPYRISNMTGNGKYGKRKIIGIAAGQYHSMILVDKGLSGGACTAIYSMGSNSHGQLGTCATSDEHWPTVVAGLAGEQVTQIGTKGNHSWALTNHGELFTFGNSEYRAIGFGKLSSVAPKHLDLTDGGRRIVLNGDIGVRQGLFFISSNPRRVDPLRVAMKAKAETREVMCSRLIENSSDLCPVSVVRKCTYCNLEVCAACVRNCHGSHNVMISTRITGKKTSKCECSPQVCLCLR